MNLEIHHGGQSDYLDIIKEKFNNTIEAIKNNKLLTSATKKAKIESMKRAFLKKKTETNYNSF